MTDLIYGSAALEDNVFVTEFENYRFPNDQFRHADPIRLAWIYIRRYEYEVAEERMRQSIHGFARNLGAEHKYHETITILWMRLVKTAVHLSSRIDNFADFARAHAWLLDKGAIFEFHSRGLVMSDTARNVWVEPDLKSILVPQTRITRSDVQRAHQSTDSPNQTAKEDGRDVTRLQAESSS